MSFNWQTLLLTVLSSNLLCCWNTLGVGGQLFEQPATNAAYTTYKRRSGDGDPFGGGGGATQLPNQVNAIQITKATELHDIKDTGALAPLLQQLFDQTMPNWQQPQQQPELQQRKQQQEQMRFQPQRLPFEREQPKQQQQQNQPNFFVYETSEPMRLASQQPQILQEFNGVNVRQQQQQQSTSTQYQQHEHQQQQQQQHQQQQFTQLPIQMPQKQNQYIHYLQTAPKIALAPPASAAAATTTGASTATWPPAAGIVAPIGSLGSSFQPTSPQANHATDEGCERCCMEKGEPLVSCSCCNVKPLLSAKLLKATSG